MTEHSHKIAKIEFNTLTKEPQIFEILNTNKISADQRFTDLYSEIEKLKNELTKLRTEKKNDEVKLENIDLSSINKRIEESDMKNRVKFVEIDDAIASLKDFMANNQASRP